MSVRAGLLLLAAGMTLAVFILVPRRKTFFTTWGTRTLYVYLLHGPVVWLFRRSGAFETLEGWGLPGVVLLVAIAAALTAVLSTAWVRRAFKPLVEPPVGWLLRRG